MMEQMPLSADVIRSLQPYDIRVLHALERLMRRFEWVPVDDLRGATRFSEKEVQYRLGRLMARDLVRFDAVPYRGYALIFNGLDSLALHALSGRGSLRALGSLIGEGKEAQVFEGLGLAPVAIKFHHVGQRSFNSVRLNRDYLPERTHCPWIFASRLSAEQEFEALTRLQSRVSVPEPIAIERHAIVMDLIGGTTLNRAPIDDPEAVLERILDAVREAYRLGVIHNDLSEFNVMIDEDRVVLIDWPQWVGPDHPNSRAILERDLDNILTFFARKYRIRRELNSVVESVVG